MSKEQPVTATDQRTPVAVLPIADYRDPRISAPNDIGLADKFVDETARTAGTGMLPVFGASFTGKIGTVIAAEAEGLFEEVYSHDP